MSRTSTGRGGVSCRRRAAPRIAPPARLIVTAGVVDVDAFERGREAVGIALAPHLAVGDDVDAGALHVADRDQGRVVLRLFEESAGDAPHLRRAHARHLRAVSLSRSTSQSGCG